MRHPDEAAISVQIHPPGHGRTMAFTLPIALHEARQLFQPIDFPSDDAGLGALFCTPDAERKLLSRKKLITEISRIVAQQLADALGATDTEMGYPKKART